ncbi:MAG: FAA hydrolase family protein [Desulfobacteraceae bacterium]|nr:MAG: FAA hydrolase family protein [Desulfobacteraceae bacterium]
MKLGTFVFQNLEHVGLLVEKETVADVTAGYAAYLHDSGSGNAYELAKVLAPRSMLKLIEGGRTSLAAIKETGLFLKGKPDLKGIRGEKIFYSLDEVNLRAPIPRPPKILAPALNHKQVWERIIGPTKTNPHPVYFIKLSTCVTGPYDPIEIPDIGVVGSEVEIGLVVGRRGKNIPIENAEEYIFGYTIHNDITAHELRDKEEWVSIKSAANDGKEMRITYAGRYKCFDTFAPMGPWLVTKDEMPSIQNCPMEARLNGKPIQKGTTADMVFNFSEILSYFSKAHTLEPGDILSSGTCTFAPGWNLKNVDLRKIGGVLESEVDGIGTLRNPIKPI